MTAAKIRAVNYINVDLNVYNVVYFPRNKPCEYLIIPLNNCMKGKFKIITKVGTITNTALEWF